MASEEKRTKIIDPDFPFYKENPKLELWGILLLAAAVIWTSISVFAEINYPGYSGPIIFCAIPLAAFLIAARGRMSLIVKKFKAMDFVRIFVTLILQYVFAIGITVVRKMYFNAAPTANSILDADMNGTFWGLILIQLFGEEMYKLLTFLLALILMYRLTKNRTLSVVVATVIMLLVFALIHASSYDFNWIQILINQGLATFFCFYNYAKSKNILTSYIQHVLLDAIPFLMAMAGLFDNIM
ncbi:MAG: hypothetical protein J5509_09505 [Lachnospiraceae bacterium]|nr:hypothetical protein [Lachnospiraceae bacterium]